MKYLVLILLFTAVSGCKSPEARYPVSQRTGSFIKKSAERNIQLNEREEALINNIMDSQPEIDFIPSENGFWYYYNIKIENDSLTPGFGDLVNYNYDVKDLRGQLIYSKDEVNTQNYTMDKEELFTGLREGLKLMKAGETVTFLFPSQMAYGYYGDENRIGTNVPLICRVTVNSITPKDSN